MESRSVARSSSFTVYKYQPRMMTKLKSNSRIDHCSATNSWNCSHTSAATFFQNKHGFPEPKVSWIIVPIFRQAYETSRKLPSFPVLPPRAYSSWNTITPQFSGAFTSFARSLGNSTRSGNKSVSEVLKYLNSKTVTDQDRQKLLTAFAEGFKTAHTNPEASPKWGFFRILRYALSFSLMLGVAFLIVVWGMSRFLPEIVEEVRPEKVKVTFEDVKGIGDAKQELEELVGYLRYPKRFTALGATLPKGVLLVGQPGTGKTLLARAVAGEARVPFFRVAGSEFDELFVGQGARRVRDLFRIARSRAPCVIFIDEIDSVGSQRTDSARFPYANQTVNQLLNEMDGFETNEGVIVLGATNRVKELDEALLRPGRFDMQIEVPLPDLAGRKEILSLYMGKVKLDPNVDLDVIGKSTTGFTGAALASMINQAALKAAVDNSLTVTMSHIEDATDKIIMGRIWKSRIPGKEDNLVTAYHEGGHAIVAYYTKDATPIHKVTILARGLSLGHTAFIPEKEEYRITKSRMMAEMDVLMGGRAAEEVTFGPDKVTTGAAEDLAAATALATDMVKTFGMSEKVGPRTFVVDEESLLSLKELADTTTKVIDDEINRLLAESYQRAKDILIKRRNEHGRIAEALLKYETLESADVENILSGKEIRVDQA